MKIVSLLFLFCYLHNAVTGQKAVYFYTDDSLQVRGDLYLQNSRRPFIILCHQEGSNRSEYYEIAPRLLNLNYNCLAIDLRSGGKTGYVQNETAGHALSADLPVRPLEELSDLKAAISYAQSFSNQPVVLLGSSYSASLCLLLASVDPRVKAVIALSPGEYFQPMKIVGREVRKINQPVFVSATQTDYAYLQNMLSEIPAGMITLFKPEKSRGMRGSGAFLSTNQSSGEYWFALMMFFKKL